MVLVGHSYAGMIITGVAETMEKSISSFVVRYPAAAGGDV